MKTHMNLLLDDKTKESTNDMDESLINIITHALTTGDTNTAIHFAKGLGLESKLQETVKKIIADKTDIITLKLAKEFGLTENIEKIYRHLIEERKQIIINDNSYAYVWLEMGRLAEEAGWYVEAMKYYVNGDYTPKAKTIAEEHDCMDRLQSLAEEKIDGLLKDEDLDKAKRIVDSLNVETKKDIVYQQLVEKTKHSSWVKAGELAEEWGKPFLAMEYYMKEKRTDLAAKVANKHGRKDVADQLYHLGIEIKIADKKIKDAGDLAKEAGLNDLAESLYWVAFEEVLAEKKISYNEMIKFAKDIGLPGGQVKKVIVDKAIKEEEYLTAGEYNSTWLGTIKYSFKGLFKGKWPNDDNNMPLRQRLQNQDVIWINSLYRGISCTFALPFVGLYYTAKGIKNLFGKKEMTLPPAKIGAPHCPVCANSVSIDSSKICFNCGSLYHKDCLEFNDGVCGRYACATKLLESKLK